MGMWDKVHGDERSLGDVFNYRTALFVTAVFHFVFDFRLPTEVQAVKFGMLFLYLAIDMLGIIGSYQNRKNILWANFVADFVGLILVIVDCITDIQYKKDNDFDFGDTLMVVRMILYYLKSLTFQLFDIYYTWKCLHPQNEMAAEEGGEAPEWDESPLKQVWNMRTAVFVGATLKFIFDIQVPMAPNPSRIAFLILYIISDTFGIFGAIYNFLRVLQLNITVDLITFVFICIDVIFDINYKTQNDYEFTALKVISLIFYYVRLFAYNAMDCAFSYYYIYPRNPPEETQALNDPEKAGSQYGANEEAQE
eukprot:GFYU01001555.1.p1 GENE.GFYU01001555.1~~GFYU01001555.1.p1  ORF type:complete len:308 (+),score=120.62 GFYU01001555.1:61-984(+)